jgi:hypothetical protein
MDLSTIRGETHRRLLGGILDEVKRDGEAIGLLLKGSVARGDAYPGSDLDLQVLLGDGCSRTFRAEDKQGVLVEWTYVDGALARSTLERDPMNVYAYLDGRILYDPHGRLRALTGVARARYEAYRAPVREKRRIAHWLQSAKTKIVAARDAGDELRASYVASTTSWVILEGIWAACDKPVPPSGALWAHIPDLSTSSADVEACMQRLFGEDTSDRVVATLEIVDWVVPLLER